MERDILAVGWTPTNVPTNTHRGIMIVKGLPDLSRNAPCVLCVRGDVASPAPR